MAAGTVFGLGSFPQTRMRRNRRAAWTRRLVAETRLAADDLIWPVFVHDGPASRVAIPSLPGAFRCTIDALIDDVGEAKALGVPLVALFPVIPPDRKTADGDEALNPDNVVCRAVAAVKAAHPDIGVMCDVALDPFTSHGHDGLVRNGEIVNDETLTVLTRQALVQAQAGCDVIAPSDMMDGRIGAIRAALDAAGFSHVRVLAYAAKYATTLYGPFRDALGSSATLKGDKRSYQMDPANSDEALHEVALDIAEGADMVMVKPGLFYLDIIHRIKQTFGMPTAAYQVSGEYAMIKAAGLNGWLDADAVLMESLICLKRAGADAILTYGAVEAARALARNTWPDGFDH